MMLRCNKILITGGGSGIGSAIAKRLINGGAKAVITGRSLENLEKAKKKSNLKICILWTETFLIFLFAVKILKKRQR